MRLTAKSSWKENGKIDGLRWCRFSWGLGPTPSIEYFEEEKEEIFKRSLATHAAEHVFLFRQTYSGQQRSLDDLNLVFLFRLRRLKPCPVHNILSYLDA